MAARCGRTLPVNGNGWFASSRSTLTVRQTGGHSTNSKVFKLKYFQKNRTHRLTQRDLFMLGYRVAKNRTIPAGCRGEVSGGS